MHEGSFILSNPNQYTVGQIAKYIRDKTPEGVEFVKIFHESRLKSKRKNEETSLYLESNTYKVLARIRNVIQWGRSLVAKVLRSNTKLLK